MERQTMAALIFLSCFLYLFHPSVASNEGVKDDLDVYIVIVKDRDGAEVGQHQHTESWHSSLLSTVIPNYSSRLVYSYHRIINGFAARLTKSEVETLQKQDWFVQAIPSGTYKLSTTHSPAFLGLRNPKEDPTNVWNATNMGEGIIIGILDTGITPGHPSFRDEGLPPPPAKWKGHCDFNASVCNNKLIGARTILKASGDTDHIPPFDNSTDGHGTHVSSIAAGAFVNHAEALGYAKGTASGIAPRAHIAFYKSCEKGEPVICHGADLLKAIETAVDDGVDVLSLSFEGTTYEENSSLSTNPVLVGSFYAMLHGVLVTSAGGNKPWFGEVDNDVPWLLTVGASSTDRRISSIVELGNGIKIDGEAFMQPKNWSENMLPIKYIEDCDDDEIDKQKVQGNIILCLGIYVSSILTKEAAGIILANVIEIEGNTLPSEPQTFPYTYVGYADGVKIKAYILSSPKASATFHFEGTVINFPRSPAICSFSSKGPSRRFPRILKPDIVGPGLDILAAASPKARRSIYGPSKYEPFKFMSGTSMASPHLAGVGALLKKTHPKWSPAAIKSAIMTTAYVIDREGKPITDDQTGLPAVFYSLGAGHVDLKKALDPGLVYDMKPKEYIPLLCGLGLTDAEVGTIISPLSAVKCSQIKKISQEQLNYPSIVVTLNFKSKVVIKRRVKNVGDANSTYTAKIDVPSGISARVTPATLSFNKINQQRRFTITFTWEGGKPSYAEGQLKWVSTKHVVRSPIVINKAFPNGTTLLPYIQPIIKE